MPSKGPKEIKVGDGATLVVGSDRYPYTVVEVVGQGFAIKVLKDRFRRTDSNGQSESQEYEFTPGVRYSPGGQNNSASLDNAETAHWAPSRRRYSLGGTPLYVGERDAYQDPSF